MSLNRLEICGNLTAAPDIRTNAAGEPWATFTVAVNERSKQGDTWADVPMYFDVKAFGRCAKYLDRCALGKGDKLAVFGRMVQEKWTTKDGEKRTSWRVVAEELEPMSRAKAAADAEVVYEDLPF